MSKIDKYNMFLYPSILVALRELMAPYRIKGLGDSLEGVYLFGAQEEVASFLCLNDIPHIFTVNGIDSRFSARLVVVSWKSAKGEESMAWWEAVR